MVFRNGSYIKGIGDLSKRSHWTTSYPAAKSLEASHFHGSYKVLNFKRAMCSGRR